MKRRRSLTQRVAHGEPAERVLAERLALLRRVAPREGSFASALHDERVAALLGIALAAAFGICFVTGLISHFIQNPLRIGALSQPTGPAWLYRVTQGVHVVTGTAAIPLLLVKLWAVYPRLFRRPAVTSIAHGIERVLVACLVGGSLFILMTGEMATAQWVPWEFRFRQTHFWTSFIVIGALVAHIGAKLAISRRALRRDARARMRTEDGALRASRPGGLTRRGLLISALAGAGAVVLTTAGQTLRPLRSLALLAPRRPDAGPQGLPVNRTAKAAGVLEASHAGDWALLIDGDVPHPVRLSLDDLRALPQCHVTLPIACVEGWSASARWTGVSLPALLRHARAPKQARVAVESLERAGLRRSTLNPAQAADADTLLALAIDGEPLHPDHGYPCRLIAPNRPGVQQTKWVTHLRVQA